MASTPIELGALLDDWVASGRAGLVETVPAVTISRLDAMSAQELLAVTHRLGWGCDVHDRAGEPAHADEIDENFGPFVATILKAVDGADRRLLTRTGLSQALAAEDVGGVWQVACAQISFATGTTSFNPWGSGDVFAPAAATKSPLDIVREASEARIVPTDIRKWLLRGEVTEAHWRDAAFQTFAVAGASALIRSLASEVVGQRVVVFNGPPRLSIALPDDRLVGELDLGGYQNLQAAVAWVYEDRSSAEQRHALFAAEFARSVVRDEPIGRAFQAAGRDVLEGSRLAFQLSQSDLSREAIKAQGDLRKAIADDTSKAAEGTRTLTAAIAVAIATGITLIAARSTGATEPWVLSLVAAVVGGYLVVVAISGWAYLNLQRALRDQWRRRFYRFVPADDYEAMVTKPARSAEWPYHFVAMIALIVAAALGWMAFAVLGNETSLKSATGTAITDEGKSAVGSVKEPSVTAPAASPSALENGQSQR